MNIIIVGCGKVGYTLVEQLGGENHNITVIDTNEEKVNSITDDLDAMGDRKSTRLNSSHMPKSRMPSSA